MGKNLTEGQKLKNSIKIPLLFVLIICIVQIIQGVFGIELGYLGIHPRTFSGMIGIFLAPLIHGDFMHVISNILPFFLLLSSINYFYPRIATRSFLMIYFVTGLVVWIFARNVYHIGASGVVYGLVSFLFWNGIFRKSLKSIIISLIIVVLYSGYVAGILPNQEGISWESHLIGGIIGIFTAYYFKNELEEDEVTQLAYKNRTLDDSLIKKPFFAENIFNFTKAEREAMRIEAEKEAIRLKELENKKDDDIWYYDIS